MPNILVLCTGNSCRSQMAHGYLESFAGGNANVYSAGIETHGLNPEAVSIMLEDGIDISGHTSNHVDEYQDIVFDYIITVCDHAQENCPYIPGNGFRIHQNFQDPSKLEGSAEERKGAFLETREAIKAFAKNFVTTYLKV